MDSALVLRMKVDQNKEISDSFDYLDHSDIIKNYAKMTKLKPLGKIFALIGLAEIPYAENYRLLKNCLLL